MSGTLREIKTEDEFERLVATSTKPVLVDLGAAWCGPCQALTPILEDFVAAQDVVDVVTIDADDPRPLSWRLGGSTIPRLYLYDRGVLQMEVAGVRDRAWLDDVVAGYPALGITEPDGIPLPERTPARTITIPAPALGQAAFMVVHGHDNDFTQVTDLPCTQDVSAGSHTVLNVSAEAIASGYLAELAPDAIDEVRIMGQLTPEGLKELTRLTALRTIQSFGGDLDSSDLEILTSLPSLRRISLTRPDGTPVPLPNGLFPHVLGTFWLAPSLAAARNAAGLPEYDDHEPHDNPVEVACLLKRQDDNNLELAIVLTIAEGWYAYPPGSADGVPVSITLSSGHTVATELAAESAEKRLEGRTKLLAVLSGQADEVRLDVTVQACDGTVCLAPKTTHLVVPLMNRR